MQSSEDRGALQAALRFLIASDMPANHKGLFITLVTDALRSRDAADQLQQARKQEARPWDEHELATISEFLEGKMACSWQHADELVVALAGKLHRDFDEVREKASEAGFGAAVDFKASRRSGPADGRLRR
jgi:hypothetical protein